MENRKEIIDNLNDKLHEIDKEIDVLEMKSRNYQRDVRELFNQKLLLAKGKRDEAFTKIANLKASSHQAFSAMLKSVEMAYTDLKSGVLAAKEALSDTKS